MSYVFVLDTDEQPLNPVHPGWARKLLSSGRAAVYKRYPTYYPEGCCAKLGSTTFTSKD